MVNGTQLLTLGIIHKKMGISLNGLTPANTYQSLIKVGDNSQLTATLKTLSDGFGTDLPMQVSTSGVNFTGTLTQNGLPISTTPSGVAGAIQFSDGSAFSSDAANLFWDDTNKRLGIGTNAPTLPIDILGGTSNGGLKVRAGNTTSQNILDIANNAGTKGWVYRAGDGVLQFYGGNFQIESQSSSGHIVLATGNGSGGVGINVSSPTARLHIKGSGSTSATTALLVQNSAGADILRVKDGGSDKQVVMNSAVIGSFDISGALIQVGTGNNMVFRSLNGVAFNSNYSSANASAQLDVSSTTKGFLPPRMTTTQKNAISSPASGLMVYDTDTNKLSCYNGTSWNDLF